LSIPFRSKNDNELYDGDLIAIPTLGAFNVKLYDTTFEYNNVL
jgi:hypothetical protein